MTKITDQHGNTIDVDLDPQGAAAGDAAPTGDYAIVELFGHQTVVGRVTEIDRFGTKFMQIESIYLGKLLPPLLQGGASIYRLTPCSAEVAFTRGATMDHQLPQAVRATLPPHLLPAPAAGGDSARDMFEDVDSDSDGEESEGFDDREEHAF